MFERRTSVVKRILRFLRNERDHSNTTVDAIQKKAAASKGLSVTTVVAAGVAITAALAAMTAGSANGILPSSMLQDFKGQMFPGTDLSAPLANMQSGASPVPSPTVGSRRRPEATEEVKHAILSASKASAADYTLVYSVAGVESAFKSDARASTSSATGMFQFTTSTWNYLTQKLYPWLNYSLADRLEPFKAAKVAGLYLNSIRDSLKKRLGRMPSHAEIYLGYFLGPSGAGRFLEAMKKNPNAIGAGLFPEAASANPGVFYKNGRALSLQEILSGKEDKLTAYAVRSTPASMQMASGQSPNATASATVPQVASAAELPVGRPERQQVASAEPRSVPSTVVVPTGKPQTENDYFRGRNGVLYSVPA
jgi:hypothetical protein